jgi:hypothetical protein
VPKSAWIMWPATARSPWMAMTAWMWGLPSMVSPVAMVCAEVRNAELIESLTRQAAEHGITDAAIVTLIGAADSFTGSTPAGDPTVHSAGGRLFMWR